MIRKHLRVIVVAIALLTVCASIFSYIRHFDAVIQKLLEDDTGHTHTCVVNSYPLTDGNKIKFYAKVTDSDSTAGIDGYNLYVSAPSDAYDIINYGNTLRITCPVTVADESANYGNFDYRNYLMSRNAVGILYIDTARSIEPVAEGKGLGRLLYYMQRKAIFNLSKYFNGNDRALITAILTGDRSEFNGELFEKYKIAGIYHIVAVSGLHTSIFISIIAYLLAMLPVKSRKKALITKIASVVISILLLMFTGYGVSVVRVILMTSVTWLCLIVRREYNVIISIITSAFLILIFAPYQLFSSSFQLSFLSTLGMCAALDAAGKHTLLLNTGSKIVTSVVISAGSTVATAPVCAYSFGAISLLGIGFNLIAIPVSTALLVSALVFSLLSVFLPESVMLILRLVPMLLARIINGIANLAQKLSFLYISINTVGVAVVMAVIVAVALMIYLLLHRRFMRIAVLTTLILSVNILLMQYNSITAAGQMRVTFINAVKGEATLITTPDKRRLMFDCGSATFQSPGEDLFRTYFMHNGIRKIDKLYISYFDDEHINAVNKLIHMGYVKQVVLPPEIQTKSQTVALNRRKIINTANNLKIPVVYLHSNSVIDEGSNVRITFAGNNFDMQDKNGCAVYRISYNDVSFVLSSCLGAKGQTQLTGKTQCTVLKLPNYGTQVKATEQYILTSKPEYAVITAPARDKYARVDQDIISLLENNDISYARTDANQTTTFVTDGVQICKVITRKGSLK